MIELTDKTRRPAYRAARQWAAEHGHPQPDDRMVDRVIAVVLTVAARQEPDVTFRTAGGVVAVYVGDQRVVRLPEGAEQAINALVDVLEALGAHPRNASLGSTSGGAA